MYSLLRRDTGIPLLVMSVKPLAMLSIPSVTTNGGTRKKATMDPFTSPSARPASRPIGTATYNGYCSPMLVLANTAAAMPPKAKTEPTDKSIPPVRMTNVMPIASKPLMDVCRSTLRRLTVVRKCSLVSARAMHSRKNAMMIPLSIKNARTGCPRLRDLSRAAVRSKT
jgi:hypothetical protein